jgi:hypothetical protein
LCRLVNSTRISPFSTPWVNTNTILILEYYINVEDVARIHAIALLDPEVKSERLFAFASTFQWTEIIQILRKYRPDSDKIAAPPENEGKDLSVVPPAKRAEDLLKSWFEQPGWVSLEQSLKDGLDTYSP